MATHPSELQRHTGAGANGNDAMFCGTAAKEGDQRGVILKPATGRSKGVDQHDRMSRIEPLSLDDG